MKPTPDPVVVVGGGVAGLAAAALLARAGRPVLLCEGSPSLGGRAATRERDGFHLNLGPHALYVGGPGAGVLAELGIQPRGGTPRTSGYALYRGRLFTLPVGFVSLLTTGLLSAAEKIEAGRLLARLPSFDARSLDGVALSDWLGRTVQHPQVRRLLLTLGRLTTYVHAPDRQSAGAVVAQIQLALGPGVLYLDGGWQQLVDALRDRAGALGARIEVGRAVERIVQEGGVLGVRFADGQVERASAVVLAVGLAAAAKLIESRTSVHAAAETVLPARAACLDVALSKLPRPRALFALGIDQPLYLSVHSASARLAPPGAALIHVAKYLSPDAPAGDDDRQELEALLDLVQPGWRARVVFSRFLPQLTVTAIDRADAGGVPGRPAPEGADLPGLYLAGDGVGPDGLLVHASLASARQAAEAIAGGAARQAA